MLQFIVLVSYALVCFWLLFSFVRTPKVVGVTAPGIHASNEWVSVCSLKDAQLEALVHLLVDDTDTDCDEFYLLLADLDECCFVYKGTLLSGAALLRYECDERRACGMELSLVQVAAPMRGHGIGTALLASCLERSRGLGLPLSVALGGPKKPVTLAPWFQRVGFCTRTQSPEELELEWDPESEACVDGLCAGARAKDE